MKKTIKFAETETYRVHIDGHVVDIKPLKSIKPTYSVVIDGQIVGNATSKDDGVGVAQKAIKEMHKDD